MPSKLFNRFIFATLCLISASSFAETLWSYSGKTGPTQWGALDNTFAACTTGHNQSPINIPKSKTTLKETYSPIYFNFKSAQAANQPYVLTNNGHTLQVQGGDQSDMIWHDQNHQAHTYHLIQFHFHAPSENTVDGKQYPLEIHFVYQNNDKTAEYPLAVVAVFVQQSTLNHNALEELIKELPLQKNQTALLKSHFGIKTLLPKNSTYYEFAGSLTTPPCTENVRWFVMEQPINASAGQINKLSAALGDNTAIGHNIRPVQPLYDRQIIQAIF